MFFSVFGGRAQSDDFEPEDAQTVASPPDDRPTSEHKAAPRESAEHDPGASVSSSPPGERDGRGRTAEVEVPLAMASDEELLRRKSFDALEPHELAQLYRLMSRLELATPLRRTRRYEKARHGERIDLRRTLRASLRTAGDPSASRVGAGASRAGGSCCCATSPARWSRTRAPTCSS